MFKKVLLLICILIFGLVYVNAYAQTSTTIIELVNPTGEQDIWGIVNRIINVLFMICIYGGLILIIWAGWTMITSQGDPKKMSNGTKMITSVLIGIVVVLLARSIISLTYYIVTGKKGGLPNLNTNSTNTVADPNTFYDPSSPAVPSYEVTERSIPESVFESGFGQ